MDDDSIIMRFGLEGKVDEKQIKQEMDKAQKVADAGEVKIPTKTKEVDPKNIKQEVESVQKVADKTPVEIPVKLTQKEIKEELNKLIKQKGKSQKEVRAKLDDIMKDMDFSDTIKESIKTLFIKYRSMSNSSKGFSSASQSSKDEFIKLAEKFSKATGSKKASPMVKVMSDLTASQAQKYRNEKRSPEQLKQNKQKIIDDVNKERAKQDAARQNIQKAYTKKQKATEFVEGKIEDGQTKPGMKQLYEDIIASTEQYKKFTMDHTDNGQNKKAVSFWGDPKEFDKFISVFQRYVDKGVADYNNRDELVPKAKKEYEDVTKNLEVLEAESVKRLEEINKLLGPIEKISIDPSKLTPKHYQDLFKEPLPPQKFKLKRRTLTDDVADAAINRDFLKKLARGASRGKANEVGSDINLGLRQPVMDGPYVDKNRIIRTAIGGPYADTSSYVRSAIETQKASYKLAKETLEKFIVELNKLQEVIDQRNAEVNAKAEAEGRMGIAGKGRNKNEITEQEKNAHLSQISTELAGKEEKKIGKGDPTADVKVFEETLKASFGFLTQSLGPSIWKPLEQNINRIMANFAGGTFKITDDPIKGEGKNYAELAKLLSEYFKDINEFFKQNPEMEQLAKVSMQLKNAARISQDVFEQALKDNMALLIKFGYKPGEIPTPIRGTSTQNKNQSPVTGNTNFAKFATDANKNLEKNNTFAKIGNVAQEENAKTNKLNANTGTDSEAGKNEVVKATKDVGTTIEKTFPSGNGGNGRNGGNNFGGGDLGDTGPSILEQIRDILIRINSYTTAIFDILPKLKLTIKREKRSKKKDNITSPNIDTTKAKDSLGVSMEINKVWDTIAEEFEGWIKPIQEALLPVVSGELKDRTEEAFQAIRDAGKIILQDNTDPANLRRQQAISDIERAREEAIEKNKQARYSGVGLSQDISTTTKSLGGIIKKAFGLATATTEVDRIKNLNQTQREKELAALTKTYGIADRDRNVTSTGDKGRAFRMKSVYGYRQKDANPFKDLKLTPGLEIDTKGITDALQTMIEKNMFSAQTGVNSFADLIKLSFGGIGMPSLEKSRAQVDAANEILGIIRQTIQELLQAIQGNETTLRGLEASGDAKFDDKGQMVSGSDDAKAVFGQLEEQKSVLNGLIAELTKMDQLSAETGGNMTEFFKVLGFVSPELRKCNTIIGNINSGLNKNGKVLKFQSRFQETLNYSFQLLTRHIGQMIKGWILMLNPINVIKKAFSDFGSYDVKWQRTMNVIKINFQRIIKPAMEWIAQKLVNIIGFFDIISQRIQAAFGKIPISLFDQAGAESEQIRRNLEEAANVSLGFDELHDVGTDQSGANNLMGDIYKPQLSQDWIDMATKLGDTLGGFFKGDLGFGDVCKVILELLGKLLASIGKAIWDWFKETSLGKWITEHWKGLLATLLTLFVGWQLLKIAGPTLLSAIGGAFKTLLVKVGGWMATLLGSWGSMIGFAVTKGLLAALTGYATYKAINHFGDNLADKTSYNLGVEYAGGKDEDKKSKTLDTIGAIGSGIAGGAATGAIIGGVPGAVIGGVIGGVAGTIQSVLRPALEEAEVAARALNGELQSVSFNEAQVQTFQEQSDALTEQLNLLKQSLDTNTQSVYKQGEELGISKTRMDELVKATQDGTFNTGMLSGAEMGLADSLTDLTQKQEHYTNVSKEVEEAERNLLKAKTELTIAEDIEAGNFEIAAARIELAEAQKVYSTEEATDRRIELFEKCADEERANLLQDLTPDQKKRMTDLNNLTDTELAKLNTAWQDSSEVVRDSILSGLDENTQSEFKRRMDQIDTEIESHKGFWQSVGDTLAEIFSLGNANTWTYNGEVKYEDEVRKGKIKIQKNALGTNYVEADGLQYLHQGEAIIPKKYNQPYQPGGMSAEERAYMDRMIATMNRLDGTIAQGINVKGEFRQRGNDLVATVEKNKSRQSNTVLNNKVYAR